LDCLFHLHWVHLDVVDILVADQLLVDLFSLPYHQLIALLDAIVVLMHGGSGIG
jgi:hypothetical protein